MQSICLIASIHKKWLSWGDAFELDIDDNADEVMALAVILVSFNMPILC